MCIKEIGDLHFSFASINYIKIWRIFQEFIGCRTQLNLSNLEKMMMTNHQVIRLEFTSLDSATRLAYNKKQTNTKLIKFNKLTILIASPNRQY